MRIGIFLIKTPSFSEKFLISKIENLQKLGHEVILFVNKKDDFSACKVVDMPKVSKALFDPGYQNVTNLFIHINSISQSDL